MMQFHWYAFLTSSVLADCLEKKRNPIVFEKGLELEICMCKEKQLLQAFKELAKSKA